MALIKCPDCGTEVSDKAEKCPKCHCPIANTGKEEKPQVVELTSKKLKLQMIWAILLIPFGLIVIFLGTLGKNFNSIILFIGFLMMIIGAIWAIIIKTKIWWHHK